jgi:hypothetical protein
MIKSLARHALVLFSLILVGSAFANLLGTYSVETESACITQAELDLEIEKTGGYEITVDEFCSL